MLVCSVMRHDVGLTEARGRGGPWHRTDGGPVEAGCSCTVGWVSLHAIARQRRPGVPQTMQSRMTHRSGARMKRDGL